MPSLKSSLWCVPLLLVLIASPLWGQQPVTTTFHSADATNSNGITPTVLGFNTVSVQNVIAAAWDGTLNPEYTVDGTNYFAMRCRNTTTGAIATTFTGNVAFVCPIQGAQIVRVRTSGRTVGTTTTTGRFILGSSEVMETSVSGTVTANQGTANTVANAWPVKITNATNTAQVTAGGLLQVDGSGVTQPVSGTVTANQGTANATPWNANLSQVGGAVVVTGTGVGGAGIPRVTISSDSSLAANQSVNTAQINAVTPLMGNGITGPGSQRVTIASDNTAFTVNAAQSTAAAGTTAWGVSPIQGATLFNSSTTGAANTAVTTSVAGAAATRVHLYMVSAYCSAGSATLTIKDGVGGTTIWVSPAAFVGTVLSTLTWPVGLSTTTANGLDVVLGACGVGNTGTLQVQADRF